MGLSLLLFRPLLPLKRMISKNWFILKNPHLKLPRMYLLKKNKRPLVHLGLKRLLHLLQLSPPLLAMHLEMFAAPEISVKGDLNAKKEAANYALRTALPMALFVERMDVAEVAERVPLERFVRMGSALLSRVPKRSVEMEPVKTLKTVVIALLIAVVLPDKAVRMKCA